MRRTLCALCALFLLFSAACAESPPPKRQTYADALEAYWEEPLKLGLANNDSAVLLGGRSYRGAGVNCYNLFNAGLPAFDTEHAFESLSVLAENDIPFVRFNCGVFYGSEWKLWQNRKTSYLELLTAVTARAEHLRIGLIPCLFWNYTALPDFFDEPLRSWGDTESQTFAAMQDYTAEIVEAVGDSSAIWGWEFGNEYDLSCDLPNAEQIVPPLPEDSARPARDESDYLSTDDVSVAFSAFAKTVRERDPHRRIISSGNGLPRPSQYHQYRENSWKPDTVAQRTEMAKLQHPGEMDAVSEHLYFDERECFERTVTFAEHIDLAMKMAEELKKVYLVGEFGSDAWLELSFEERMMDYRKMAFAIADRGVPLSLIWNYDRRADSVEYSFSETSEKGKRLFSLLRETNLRFDE